MSSDRHYDFGPLRSQLMQIYDLFSDICGRYHLRYYVGWGTALGAVRHHGFIPWDDDFDVCMPREDYEQFLRIAAKELPPYLKIVNWKNTPEFDQYSFGKIQETRKEVVDAVMKQCGRPVGHGLFIDIFPLDGYVASSLFVRLRSIKILLLRCRIKYLLAKGYPFPNVQKYLPGSNKFAMGVARLAGFLSGGLFAGLKTQHDFAAYEDAWIKSIPFVGSRVAGKYFLPFIWDLTKVHSTADFGKPQYLKFEGRMVPVPGNYDRYLRVIYGDYMTLPPPEKRVPGHVGDEICPWAYGPTTNELPY